MTPRSFIGVAALALGTTVAIAATGTAREASDAATVALDLPRGFPRPKIPQANPLTVPKVELGRRLFYDKRLSGNGTQSCASCHEQARAFTDGWAQSLGSTGERHPRSAMSLANVAYATALNWANPLVRTLEDQALGPMFGTHPVEMGLAEPGDELLSRLKATPPYPALFAAAFPGEPEPFQLRHVTEALASFERTILSADSPWDRYHYRGDDLAVTEASRRGEVIFFSNPVACFRCHGGFNFSGAVAAEGGDERAPEFHNTGLYNVGGPVSYPEPNTGLFAITRIPSDVGRFKAPTLRNIELTAPYMHDGSVATLDAVLDHYAAGGRTIREGPLAGVGSLNPHRSPLLRPFSLSKEQREDLIEFLKSLTDRRLTSNPRLSDPWK